MKKFKVATLGCRTNQYESQAYKDQLISQGYSEAAEDEEADLCIINTCTVTESADSNSRHQIRSLARKNPGAKMVVTGCLAESLPQMEEVDLVVLNKDKENLLSLAYPEEEFPEFAIQQFAGRTRAFIKVQDGCNSFCTYCLIPYVRGRSRSRKVEDILNEVRTLIANGYKEIVLTGINIGDFDGAVEPPVRLAELVRIVDQVEGIERLRLSSIDPDEVDDHLIDAIMSGRNTCHSLHIVLQSGSNVVLKRMNRKYTRQMFLESIERLRGIFPDFTFTTDVIVGFPGETEEDFKETLELIEKVQFAKVHMFPYSERKRTRAALFSNKVPSHIIAQRKAIVLQLAERVAFEHRKKYIGRTMQVLLESEEGPYFTGHTENFIPVLVPKVGLESNQMVDVEFIENAPEGLIGKVYAYQNC